jgi:methionyl-tRNA synthetase
VSTGARAAGRQGPGAPGQGRGWLRDGGRAVQRLQVPHCPFDSLRTGLGECLALAREANGYTFAALSAGLDRKAPWFQIKEDRQAAATSVYVILCVVDNLKAILAPTRSVPHTAQRLHEHLGYEGQPFDRLRTGPSTPLRTGSLGRSTWWSMKRRPAATRR